MEVRFHCRIQNVWNLHHNVT